MDKRPFFSIILPTYNSADKLRRALESVNRQSFKDFEVIVCDDGSADYTKQVVNAFNNKFRLKYLWNEHFGGPARPRNNGIKAAQAEFIAFLDADDWWYPKKLEVVKKYIQSSDILYHDLDIYYLRRKQIFKKVRGRHLKEPVFVDLMKNGNVLMTSAVIIRKSTIEKAGGMEEDKLLISVEDFDLWLKIAKITEKFTYIRQNLGVYNIEQENISWASEELIQRTQEVYRRHMLFLKDEDKVQSQALLNYFLGRIKQRMGFLKDALILFKLSVKSKNMKFKIRSLFWIILLSVPAKIRQRDNL